MAIPISEAAHSGPYLSVVIPAHDEAARLPATLADVDGFLARRAINAEVIVVDDGSRDETRRVAQALFRGRGNRFVIHSPENRGKGHAVRTGMLAARGRWRLFMDADNSTSIDQIEAMRPLMERNQPIIIGSRAIRGARLEPPQPLLKRLLGKGGNLLIQLLVLPGIWDTQCGFKCFSAEAAQTIFPLLRIDGWGFDVEALALARRLGFGIAEVPVRWTNDPRSQVGARGYARALWEVVEVWRGRRNG